MTDARPSAARPEAPAITHSRGPPPLETAPGNVAQQPKDPLMSTTASGPAAGQPPAPQSITAEERKVLAGTLVGTTIEWYDFFIYA